MIRILILFLYLKKSLQIVSHLCDWFPPSHQHSYISRTRKHNASCSGPEDLYHNDRLKGHRVHSGGGIGRRLEDTNQTLC